MLSCKVILNENNTLCMIVPLTLCMMDNFQCFSMLTFFQKKNSETLSESNGLDPDQDQHSVGPDLGLNCLQRLSADNKSRC